MNHKLRRIYAQLIPYLLIGIIIATVIGLLIVLSSILMWGILIGGAIWVISLIKNALFATEKPSEHPIQKTKGRIIEHDDNHH